MTQIYDLETLKRKATVDLPARVEALVVASDDDLAQANEIWKGTRTLEDWINKFCDPGIKSAKETVKVLQDQRGGLLGPIGIARGILERKMRDYRAAIAAKAKAEEDRLLAEASKKADEARIKALEDTPLFDATPKVTAPLPVAPPWVPKPVLPKMDGTTEVKTWKYTIEDEGKLPANLTRTVPDEEKIEGIVKALKTSPRQAEDKARLKAWGIYAYESSTFRRTA
jgi:hypothetical protein